MDNKEHQIIDWLTRHPEIHTPGENHEGYWGEDECTWNLLWKKIYDQKLLQDMADRGLIVEYHGGYAMQHSNAVKKAMELDG